jgi:D-alanyl-D-alanine carboxypeptidase/D-alanyl-D-alanine-endopeptidase (penicillin-binding protein 4)
VALRGKVRREPGAGAAEGLREIARIETSLAQAILESNTWSHNLTAECLLKGVGAAMENEGSWAAGARAIAGAFRERGIPTEGLVISDGSGLATSNRCTARQLGMWLRYVHAAPRGPVFRDSMAAGGDGTLRRKLTGAGLKDRVRLKTGYISYDGRRHFARALSGYVENERWGTLVVSILTRDLDPNLRYRIVEALVRME